MKRAVDVQLRFVEELLLFALDSDTGHLRPIPEKALAGSLAGGLLLDLAFAGRLDNDSSELILLDTSPLQDPLLDLALRSLPQERIRIPLSQAIAQVALRAVEVIETALNQLVQKEWLSECGQRDRGNAEKRYQKTQLTVERELRRRLRQLVRSPGELPDPRDVVRLGLIQACQLSSCLFSNEELGRYQERMRRLAGLEFINQAVLKAIQEFQEASYSQIAERLVHFCPEAPHQAAGGHRAVVAAIEKTYEEVGLLRGSVVLTHINQIEGFDCPGCSWPHTGKKRQRFEFCENGAKVMSSQATYKKIDGAFFQAWSIEELARQSDAWLAQQGRLVQPMIRRQGASHYTPILWEEAIQVLATELKRLDTPDEAVFYTSGTASNEAAFLLQLLARQFGTNNLPGSANLCHEASGMALTQTLGSGKGTAVVEDLVQADLILLFGHNPGSNHARMLETLQQAVRNGATIIAVNPLAEAGLKGFANPHEILGLLGHRTPLASHLLQVRINGDQALVQGLLKVVLREEEKRPRQVLDHEFIERFTTGFTVLKTALDKIHPTTIEERSGISWARIEEVAQLYIKAERTIASWCLGITQHANGVATIRDIVNLLLLRGNIGKPGAGACPVRGHSNVQGNRTMGIGTRLPNAFLDALRDTFHFEPPRNPGLDALDAIEAMHAGKVKVFMSMGGNLLSAAPETEYASQAMRRCRLTAMVSTKLNRNHLVTGEQALLLPCLGRTDLDYTADGKAQFTTVEDTMGGIHLSRGCLDPLSPELRSEPWIICALAIVLQGNSSPVPWKDFSLDYERIREAIAKVVPGFHNPLSKLRQEGAFYLPNPARERKFGGPTGKARFTTQPLTQVSCQAGQFILTTVRSHDQFNTLIHGHNDRYRGIRQARRVLFINPLDMQDLDLKPGQLVDIHHAQARNLTARLFHAVPYDLPRRCVAAYFPEANSVVPMDHRDPESNTPASKSVLVTLARSQQSPTSSKIIL
jgi:molybdopterin-dependent oxidoreductase alpha subunit